MRGWIVAGLPALVAWIIAPGRVAGQELSLHRDLPLQSSAPCAATEVSEANLPDIPEQDRLEAERLAGEASQAAILGDRERARALLQDAARLDPTSARVAYQLGRVLEAAGAAEGALAQFCRYLAFEPSGGDAEDVRQRVAVLADSLAALPETVTSAFAEGIARFDAGEFEAAVRQFSRALAAAPDLGQAHFNRAVAYLRLGRDGPARTDLERYLELRPEAADRQQVEARIAQLSPASATTVARQYSSATALLTGLLIPGMGHIYLDRPGSGLLIFLAAGGSAAAGLLYTEVEIDCLAVPEGGTCPADQVLDRRETHPRMVYGLAAAGAITLVSALHAFFSTPEPVPQGSSELGIVFPLEDPANGAAPVVLTLDPVVAPEGGGFAAAVRVPVP